MDKYADDSTLEASAKTVDQLEHKLASDMVKVEHWCFRNKMVLNIKNQDYADHNIPEASQTACKIY